MFTLTDYQIVCALFALPFVTLAFAFAAGMAALEHQERKTIRRLKAMVRGDMK